MDNFDGIEDKLNSILSDPDELKRIMELANSLSGSLPGNDFGGCSQTSPPFGGIDGKTMAVLSKVMNAYSDCGSDKAALINALRPFLTRDRCEQLDRAVSMARLAKAAKTAISEFGGG